jgi:CRP/FNR family transcriptional regulator, anaerobic regulatory protein
MNRVTDKIQEFGALTPQQAALIESRLVPMDLPKGTYFGEAGKTHNRVGFIIEGIMRVCYYDNKGQEITRCFISEKNFVVDTNSFYNQIAASEYVEAVTDCTLFVLERDDFNDLAATILSWNDIFAKMSSASMMRKLKISQTMLGQEAKDRYLGFLQNYPGLANQVPLHMLASYLGITQSSLSRIRKNI